MGGSSNTQERIVGAAERHLAGIHGMAVSTLSFIRLPEEVQQDDVYSELDARAVEIDDRRRRTPKIKAARRANDH